MHIVQSVPEFYRQRMAETLRITLAAGPLDALIYGFHDEAEDEAEPGNIDGDFGNLEDPILTLDGDSLALTARRENIARRLNGRCRGLLEMNSDGVIGFLHRTVFDFLRTREMSTFLDRNTADDFSRT